MADGVLVDPNDMERVWRATLKSERDPSQVPGEVATRTPGRPKQTIRAILLEPLHGSQEALAMVCRREKFSRLVDVQIVGTPDDVDTWSLELHVLIPGQANTVTTDPFGVYATAEQLHDLIVRALVVDPLDVFVSGGTIAAEIVPSEIPTTATQFVLSRWTIAFVGEVFNLADPWCVPVKVFGSSSSMLLSSESTWRPTGEVVKVIEAGLNPHNFRSYGNQLPRQSPLVVGSVVLAHWCDDADGYVVGSAEPRKFNIEW